MGSHRKAQKMPPIKNDPQTQPTDNFSHAIKSLHTLLTARGHLTAAIHAASSNVLQAAAAAATASPAVPISPTANTADPALDQINHSIDVMLADWLNGAGEFGTPGLHGGTCEVNYNTQMRNFANESFALQRAAAAGKNVQIQMQQLLDSMKTAAEDYGTCLHAPIPLTKQPSL
jgi:hypothetical protein